MITYSTSGGDPFRAYNSAYHSARANYYGVSGIPHCWADGVVDFHPGSMGNLTGAYNQRIDVESPVEIEVMASAAGSSVQVVATVNSADEAVSGNYVIHMALICLDWDLYHYNAGQEYGHHSLLDMSPNASGATFSIDANDTETFNGSFEWPITLQGHEIETDNVEVTVWIQNNTTEEVIQCQSSGLAVDYMFTAEAEENHDFAELESTVTFDIDIDNVGLETDTYDIEVTGDMPDGWSYSYTTPDGDQSGPGTLTLESLASYTSTLSINTNDVPGDASELTCSITSQNLDMITYDLPFFVMNTPSVLVVNGDLNGAYGDYFTNALDYVASEEVIENLSYGVWPVVDFELDMFDLGGLEADAVIWYLGDDGDFTDQNIAGLQSYLSQGYSLWISGSRAPSKLNNTDLITSMGAEYQDTYPSGDEVYGVDDDPVGDGLDFALTGGDGADNLGIPTSMLEDGGTTCLRYSAIRRAGIRNIGGMGDRSLLMGFPFEAIADEDSRNTMMLQTLTWLLPGGSDAPEQDPTSAPQSFSLSQNHPNPFNPTTEIAFTLPHAAQVQLTVFDVMGREVMTLTHARFTPGSHRLTFDGGELASGVYFYRMTVGGEQAFEATRKMMLMK